MDNRGAKTIRGLAKVFRKLDSYDGDKKVGKNEFLAGLKEIGVILTKNEADVISMISL